LNQLTVPPQFDNPTARQATGLNHRIQGHLHRLGSRQPVAIGIDHSFTQLNRRPSALQCIGNEPFEQVVLQLSIRIKNQQPLPFELGKGRVQRSRLAATGIARPVNHVQAWVILSQGIEQGWRLIQASIVDHPGGQSIHRVAQSREPLNQASHHSLFIPSGHHHIKRWELANR
jgi:hypothetical protein